MSTNRASKVLKSEFEFWERIAFYEQPLDRIPDINDLSTPFALSSDERFLERIGDVRGLRVLDVGSGYGNLTFFLEQRGADVIGLDLITKMCRWCRTKRIRIGMHSEFVGGNAQELPFADESFDLVVGMRAIHHFPDLPDFFKEAMRVLRPKGRIVLVEPLKGNPIVELNRKVLAPERHSASEHPLVPGDIKAAKEVFQNVGVETFYLISPAAFLFERLVRSPRFFALISRGFQRLEKDFMNRRRLQRFCWQAVIFGDRPT